MANLTDGRAGRKLPRTVLMTDEARHPDPGPAIAGLAAGSAVIFRHYGAANRRGLAEKLARQCRSRHLLFLVAGDPRLALAVNADGLHIPERLVLGPGNWRLWRRPGWLVTAAAHSPAALARAARAGVDAALLSPVFATRSHPGAPTIGPLRFAAWARRAAVPVYALGGLSAVRPGLGWRRIRASGAAGWASVGGFTANDGKTSPSGSGL